MQKLDKNRNVTQEYLDYVSSLDRKDLETFYIGADLLVDRLNKTLLEIQTILATKQKLKGEFEQTLNIQEEKCLELADKVLGVDKE